MEQMYGPELEDHYGVLARHFGRSDNLAKAIDYAELTGQHATRQAVNDDAVT